MTKKQKIWLEIGLAYETEPELRTERQKELSSYGVCWAYYYLTRSPSDENNFIQCLYTKIFKSMMAYYPEFKKEDVWIPTSSLYEKGDHTREHDLIRATFAYLMAHSGFCEEV